MPSQSKLLDANLMEWIITIRSLGVTLFWLFVCKDEIIYSICHIIQILKVYFPILLIVKNVQNQRDSNNWKHLMTFDFSSLLGRGRNDLLKTFNELIVNFLHDLLKKNQCHFKFETGHFCR